MCNTTIITYVAEIDLVVACSVYVRLSLDVNAGVV